MVFAFLALGAIFGAVAAAFTIMSGGSVLLALAAYSGAGTLAAIICIAISIAVTSLRQRQGDWAEDVNTSRPVSA